MAKIAVSILAHPDDAEFLCAGTLARLQREHGWEVHIATMTPGDCGSAQLSAEEISRLRRQENADSAAVIGATSHCLEERDLRVFYSEATLEKVTTLLRHIRPEIVFTHSPTDYMLDHEMTSTVVRAGVFNAPIPNFICGEAKVNPLDRIPHLYYCDPIEGKDLLGNEIDPSFCVDISGVIDIKEKMLACHASQRDWLMKHHGMDQYLLSMRELAAKRGQRINADFAEGFRQHLGHGYPQSNVLAEILNES